MTQQEESNVNKTNIAVVMIMIWSFFFFINWIL